MSFETSASAGQISPDWEPKRFDLMHFLARILLRARLIAIVTVVSALIAVGWALTRKPFYEGRATFMPPVREVSLGGFGGFGGGFFGAQQGAMYLGFLGSRSVGEDVLKRTRFMESTHIGDPELARALLLAESRFDIETNGIISIFVYDVDPQRASDVANAYLEALYDLNRRISQASVTQRGAFYNEQVQAARTSLEAAESKLLENQEQGGILDPGSAIQISIGTEARLQASIQAAEVELSAMLQSQTEQNPEVVRMRSRVAELRSQLAQQGSRSGHGLGVQAGGAIPRLSLEAARRRRDVIERETIYEAILRQADYTRLSAEDPGPSLQVIDNSRVPTRKAGPSRVRAVEIGTVLGFLVSFLWVALEPAARAFYRSLRSEMKIAGA